MTEEMKMTEWYELKQSWTWFLKKWKPLFGSKKGSPPIRRGWKGCSIS